MGVKVDVIVSDALGKVLVEGRAGYTNEEEIVCNDDLDRHWVRGLIAAAKVGGAFPMPERGAITIRVLEGGFTRLLFLSRSRMFELSGARKDTELRFISKCFDLAGWTNRVDVRLHGKEK